MIGTSPPGPFRCGSTTWRVNAVAAPASNALPPFSRVAIPTAVAIQCVDVTTPKVPSISGRVVNGSGLILLILTHCTGAVEALDHSRGGSANQPGAALRSHPRDYAGAMALAPVLTAWQATPSISSGACRRQRSNASGQRGLNAQPGGGSIGFGISPVTGIRWRPDIARSGTAPSSILV